jgi:DNA repair protein RadD
MNLRPYQQTAVDKCLRLHDAKNRSICLVMPTGGGKTICASYLALQVALRRKGRVLWLAHRKELVMQAAKSLKRYGMDVGIIAPWAPRKPNAPVQVGSIQTVRLLEHVPSAVCVVFDEVHHIVGENEWGKVAQDCAKQRAFLIGLTATPERKDGRGLAPMFQRLVVAAKISELIRGRYLVPAEVLVPPKVIKDGIADVPVKLWERYSPNTRTVVFCSSVEHSMETVREFQARGHSAAHIDGEMATRDRDSVLRRFEAGKIKIVSNCQILTEGFDLPEIETVLLARTIGSHSLFLQMVGRGLRPSPGKSKVTILDATGASRVFGHPNLDRVYSLQGKPISVREVDASRQKECDECGLLMGIRTPQCPRCGNINKSVPKKPKKVYASRLERLSLAQRQDLEKCTYDAALDRAVMLKMPSPEEYAREVFFRKFKKMPTK